MPEQNEYYQTTRAHSTVLVGGEGQVKRLPGKIVRQASVPDLGFVVGDAAPPYEGRVTEFLRGVLFVAGNQEPYYVVVDWLEKNSDAPFQWLLHYDGEMRREGEDYVIRKGKADLLVRMVEPAQHHLEIRQGYKTYHEDFTVIKSNEEKSRELERAEYLEISPVHSARRQQYFTVLYPYAAAGSRPRITSTISRLWTGIRVERQREVDLVGLRRIETDAGAGPEGIETDARFFCLTRDRQDKPRRALVHGGSYLKLGGTIFISAEERVTRAVEFH